MSIIISAKQSYNCTYHTLTRYLIRIVITLNDRYLIVSQCVKTCNDWISFFLSDFICIFFPIFFEVSFSNFYLRVKTNLREKMLYFLLSRKKTLIIFFFKYRKQKKFNIKFLCENYSLKQIIEGSAF